MQCTLAARTFQQRLSFHANMAQQYVNKPEEKEMCLSSAGQRAVNSGENGSGQKAKGQT